MDWLLVLNTLICKKTKNTMKDRARNEVFPKRKGEGGGEGMKKTAKCKGNPENYFLLS